jgi:hypothetical protein
VGVLATLDEVGEPAEPPDIAPEPPETPTDPVEAVAASPGELKVCTPLPTVPVQAASSKSVPQRLAAARLGLKMGAFMGSGIVDPERNCRGSETMALFRLVGARGPLDHKFAPWPALVPMRPLEPRGRCLSGVATRNATHAPCVEDDVVVIEIEGFVRMPIVKAKSEDRVAAD